MEPYAIVVEGLKKSFVLPHEQHSGIKQYLINLTRSKKGYETQKVLHGLDFKIKKGEFFGIVGRNGSGKSTLLKLLAGIYHPDKGSISVDGTLVPFIELGVGFNPELTGRENIFLNGALLGFSRKQMEEKYGKIVEFSELERFMDQKLKNYSSGMQVRLAFSIAIQAQGDILLLDEVLAVGDAAFQQKCFEYFGQLKQAKKTVVLVTHDMGAVERFCSRAMLIEKGSVIKIGTSIEVAQKYNKMFIDEAEKKEGQRSTSSLKSNGITLNEASVVQGEKRFVIEPHSAFKINAKFTTERLIRNAVVGINVANSQGNIVFSANTREGSAFDLRKGLNRATFSFKDNIYANDKYTINFAVVEGKDVEEKLLFQKLAVASFEIKSKSKRGAGLTSPLYDFKIS